MQESPIFVRTYDFIFWLIPQVQKFHARPPLRAVGARAAPGDGFPGCPRSRREIQGYRAPGGAAPGRLDIRTAAYLAALCT